MTGKGAPARDVEAMKTGFALDVARMYARRLGLRVCEVCEKVKERSEACERCGWKGEAR